jgi:hypothetical protein
VPLAAICPSCSRLHRGRGRCPACRREHERARGSAHRRGYDSQHQKLRRSIRRKSLDHRPGFRSELPITRAGSPVSATWTMPLEGELALPFH